MIDDDKWLNKKKIDDIFFIIKVVLILVEIIIYILFRDHLFSIIW